MNTVMLLLASRGLRVSKDGVALEAHGTTLEEVVAHLRQVADGPPPDGLALAATAPIKRAEKYDWLLNDELLNLGYAARSLDPTGAREAVCQCTGLRT